MKGTGRKQFQELFVLGHIMKTADQIRFVNYIIDHLTQNGSLDPGLLYEHPFTDIHYAGLEGVFANTQADKLMTIVKGVNESVVV